MFEFDTQHTGSWGMPPFFQDHQNSILQYTNLDAQDPDTQFDFPAHSYPSPDSNTWQSYLDTPLTPPGTEYTEHELQFIYQPTNTKTSQSQYPLPPSSPTNSFIQSSFSTPSSTSSYSPSSTAPIHKLKPITRKNSNTQERESSPTSSSVIKRDHSSVERAYRERLNDKIDALASLLFFDSSMRLTSKGTIKPSKCLVISRAKERLEVLESQNLALRHEVQTLKQQTAILNHLLVVERSGGVEGGMGMGMGML